MIDVTKQYTYQGKQVRIYADGSDTAGGALHCAALSDDSDTKGKWYLIALYKSDLVEVWQPKEGELVWAWCNYYITPVTTIYKKEVIGYDYYAPFTGELPEAFKGLQNGK